MPKLDAATVESILSRLASLPDDTRPQWGKMSASQMRGHLQMVVEYTLGQGPELPYRGNWKSRHIFRRLIISGLVPIPHNIKLPRQKDGAEVPMPDATLDELKQTLETYLRTIDSGKASARTHPFFGVLSAKEWQGFHAAHFKHHLLQFGLK